jgi:hypothetical protein
LARHHIQWAAQFEVAAELCKRGCDVSFTMGNATPLADLMVLGPNGNVFLVDVKGQSTKNFWRIREKTRQPNLYYVLTLVGTPGNSSSFYPMSQNALLAEMQKYAARPSIKFDERFSGFNWGDCTKYKDKWTELPI